MGDKLLFNFGAKLQNSYGNFPYALYQNGVKVLKCLEWRCHGIKRRFGKPKHMKEHSAWCSQYDKKTHGSVP